MKPPRPDSRDPAATRDRVARIVGDPERIAALRRLDLLDSPEEPAFDRLTRLASRLLGTPVALVSLVDHDRQFFKSQVGLPEPWRSRRQTPLSHSFCQHVVASGEPLVVADARSHALVRDNLAVAELGVVAYAGIPLTVSSGHVLGAFCTIDGKQRDWSDDELDTLRDLAAAVVTEIELRAEVVARREAESQMRQARDRAESANRAKSEFLTKMSHELRTPLTSVIGFARVLGQSEALDEREHGYLERIRENGVHLLGLINGLLDLSRLESGRFELDDSDVDVAELVRDVLARLEGQVAGGPLELIAALPDGASTLRADPVRLTQVLVNLVGNAVKFTESGRVTVHVETDSSDRPVSISVADTGIGIPADRVAAVFEPFEQADNTTARRFGGTGLGLSISRALCRNMGFELRCESAEGKGSTFTVDLVPDRATPGPAPHASNPT